jgi:uncharacterized membrane protein
VTEIQANRTSAIGSQPNGHLASPTTPHQSGLAGALERNIEALVNRSKSEARKASLELRIADAITRFVGSMLFVYLHLAFFGLWITINLGLIPFIPRWDPSFVILAMEASVEAIFLSTFVLISQNRMAELDDRRSDLNLQISLLNEHETTKLITLVTAIAKQLDINTNADPEIPELVRDVAPEAVLDRLDEMKKVDGKPA